MGSKEQDKQSQPKFERPNTEQPGLGGGRNIEPGRLPGDGKGFFFSWEVLSPEAEEIFKVILGRQGDRDLLPIYAEKRGLDLNAALDEIRQFGVLDESDEQKYRIKKVPLD